ncbi:MAG: PTS mannose/fructose/sorbose/N-acetylgalactosamine transporter subunit IIC [Culicoidibacterales bacterium]
MEVSIIQAVAIGLVAYLGSLSVPWFLGLSGGWYTLSRPLISGFIIGLILGDVSTGIIVGVAVQIVFIALVTPGGQMPQDLNAAAYIGVTLGVLAVKQGATVASAVSIATAVGAIGTIFHNFMMLTNSFWNHRAIKAINEWDMKSFKLNHIYGPQLTQFLYRFGPTFLIIYFGQGLAMSIIEYFPVDSFVMKTLTTLGGMLPAVGVAILLRQVVKKDIELISFLVGFTFVAAMGLNMISLAIIATFFSVSHFNYANPEGKKTVASDGPISDEEEEL